MEELDRLDDRQNDCGSWYLDDEIEKDPEASLPEALKDLRSKIEIVTLDNESAADADRKVQEALESVDQILTKLATEVRSKITECRAACLSSVREAVEKTSKTIVGEKDILEILVDQQKRISEEQIRLEEDREQFRKLVDDYEMERDKARRQHQWTNQKVLLNIGGRMFHTSQHTLTRLSGNFFSSLLSGNFKVVTDADGSIFVDRDGTTFEFVLNYLRDGREVVLPDDKHILERIAREAKYYGFEELVDLCNSRIDRIEPRNTFVPASALNLKPMTIRPKPSRAW
mmetsp:Transcript_23799/g.39142  ORF Transcript_23799/g.39142 Transcript_23799/m.39142 type:complete len:286 (-) Transcript_23799:58-915(-)